MVQFIEVTGTNGIKHYIAIDKIVVFVEGKNFGCELATINDELRDNCALSIKETPQEILDKIARVQLENERLVIQPDGKIEKIKVT